MIQSKRAERASGFRVMRESTNKRTRTQNQSQAITQTNHSLSRISFPSSEAWGKMIHDLDYCNNTDSWPAWYIFHSSCSFKVSITIKQDPFSVAAFSSRLRVGQDLCVLRCNISCLLTAAHMSFLTLRLVLICLQDVQFNVSCILLLQNVNCYVHFFAVV